MRQNAELLNLRKTSCESGSIVARKTGRISSAADQKKWSCTIRGEAAQKLGSITKKTASITLIVYTRGSFFVIPSSPLSRDVP